MASIIALQTVSVSVSLLNAGGIAVMSLFDIPELKAQPASRSLPAIRWLFSRGSHIMPQAAFLSSIGFAALAMTVVPRSAISSAARLLRFVAATPKFQGYLAASLLTASIGPFTAQAMIPTNFELIQMNEAMGGSRSNASARQQQKDGQSTSRSADASTRGEGQAAEFTDLSGPQEKTTRDSTPEEDEKVRVLLGRFAQLNNVRALLCGAGGVVGLITCLL